MRGKYSKRVIETLARLGAFPIVISVQCLDDDGGKQRIGERCHLSKGHQGLHATYGFPLDLNDSNIPAHVWDNGEELET